MKTSVLPHTWWTRRCYGCSDITPHSHHLTWWGRLSLRVTGFRL